MKKIFILMITVSALLFSSCSSDPCEGKTATTLCNDNGIPVDNNGSCECTCNAGYEGADCSILSSSKFVGSWTATDMTGGQTVGPYTAAISAGTTTNSVLIGNFSNTGDNVNATISGNEVTIANQVLGTEFTVSGSGTYSTTSTGSSALNMTYVITKVSNSTTYSHTGTWTK